MDPNANLAEQIELAQMIVDGSVHDHRDAADRLAELVLALDEWRRKGGFDPYDNVRRSIENV